MATRRRSESVQSNSTTIATTEINASNWQDVVRKTKVGPSKKFFEIARKKLLDRATPFWEVYQIILCVPEFKPLREEVFNILPFDQKTLFQVIKGGSKWEVRKASQKLMEGPWSLKEDDLIVILQGLDNYPKKLRLQAAEKLAECCNDLPTLWNLIKCEQEDPEIRVILAQRWLTLADEDEHEQRSFLLREKILSEEWQETLIEQILGPSQVVADLMYIASRYPQYAERAIFLRLEWDNLEFGMEHEEFLHAAALCPQLLPELEKAFSKSGSSKEELRSHIHARTVYAAKAAEMLAHLCQEEGVTYIDLMALELVSQDLAHQVVRDTFFKSDTRHALELAFVGQLLENFPQFWEDIFKYFICSSWAHNHRQDLEKDSRTFISFLHHLMEKCPGEETLMRLSKAIPVDDDRLWQIEAWFNFVIKLPGVSTKICQTMLVRSLKVSPKHVRNELVPMLRAATGWPLDLRQDN